MGDWLTDPDTREFLILVLPFFWAIVAALIALVLYKSSKSFMEGVTIPGLPAKGVRLAGSVVIFVIAFMLLKSATNVAPRGDAILVSRDRLGALATQAGALDDAAGDLEACARAAADDVLSCQRELNAVRLSAQRLSQGAAELSAPRGAGEATNQTTQR